MKKILGTFAALAAVTALASSAYAQQNDGQHGGGHGGRSACKDDAQKFCSDVQPGGGRIIQCLEDHSKEVSDACYDVLQKFEDRKHKQDKGGQDAEGSNSGDNNGDDSKSSQ